MKKLMLIPIIIVVLISCQSEEQKLKNEVSKVIHQLVLDKAFNDNLSVEILEYNFIELDTVPASVMYEWEYSYGENLAELVELQGEIMLKEIEQLSAQASLYKLGGMKSKALKNKELIDIKIVEMDTLFKRAKKIFPLIKEKYKDVESKDSLYFASVYLKAIYTNQKTNEKENIQDTLNYILDKNLKEQRPSNYKEILNINW